jgi:hypothetical protein
LHVQWSFTRRRPECNSLAPPKLVAPCGCPRTFCAMRSD